MLAALTIAIVVAFNIGVFVGAWWAGSRRIFSEP